MKKKNEEGVVLVISLLLFLALNIIMLVAVKSTTIDTQIAVNYKNSTRAFYDAESGVHFALAKIEEEFDSKTIKNLNNFTFNYLTPEGFSFELKNFEIKGSNLFSFRSIGYSEKAKCIIEVGFRRKPYLALAMPYGVFADIELDQRSTAGCYSYNSEEDPNAFSNIFNSTGRCDVSSNQLVTIHNNILIDGDMLLGEDPNGVDGVYKYAGPPVSDPNFTGFIPGLSGNIIDMDRIDPDPLKVYNLVDTFKNNNKNADSGGAINAQNKIILIKEINPSVIITSGNYYLTGIILYQGTKLIIDCTDGPVNFYIHDDGSMDAAIVEAKESSIITVIGRPADFSLFCDTSKKILQFKHGSDYTGLLYTPFASVNMHNSGGVKGLLWTNHLDLLNSSALWYDTSITENYTVIRQSGDLQLVSWREII